MDYMVYVSRQSETTPALASNAAVVGEQSASITIIPYIPALVAPEVSGVAASPYNATRALGNVSLEVERQEQNPPSDTRPFSRAVTTEHAQNIEAGIFAEQARMEIYGDEEATTARRKVLGYAGTNSEFVADLDKIITRGYMARKRLLEDNQGLIRKCLSQYSGRGPSIDQLVQAGNLGLVRAMRKFDHRKGYSFSTYAIPWILNFMAQEVATNLQVDLPTARLREIGRLRKVQEALTEQGIEPTIDRLAGVLEDSFSKEQVIDLLKLSRRPLSFSAAVDTHDPEAESLESLYSTGEEDPLEALHMDVLRSEINALLVELPNLEATILRMTFGFDGPRLTYTEIGRRLNYSESRIRQLAKRGKERLRPLAEGRQLQEFLT